MDTYVEDQDVLFRDVFAHLSEVNQQPAAKQLDADLLKRAERSLDSHTPRPLLWRVLQTGEELLKALQQDPTPLTRLLERTVQLIPFDALKTAISTAKLEEGLQSPSLPVQLLCLAYLTKAADRPSGAAFVAASASLVQLLVTTWLSSESTEVSERALESIVALLAVDSPGTLTVVPSDPAPGAAHGQGLLWRRIFHDPEVYSLLFLWTSSVQSNHNLDTKQGRQAVTISQARLFDFVARVAQLDWAEITSTALPKVEAAFIKQNAGDARAQPYGGGLLKYVASDMISQSDILMQVLRQDFFMKLLTGLEEGGSKTRLPPRMLQAIQQEAGVDTLPSETDGMHL
ncbi:hypothetical protein DV735_g2057, partial [Chaetothyriales sp. CBS 134920]